ncbi:hypothetical protein [Mycolicibacterium aubagnense]|uniref:HNH endonuclease n=1 Tax=Mycolicibacterium aubagnense TaxID=319707 RepID=A0ABM7I6M5_9MYCO|nr:hypothetical protein [Mycolicibacterium aubagnense]TLH48997.1 hypothetical protein C1S80_29390 [Mycolicibacterium aubagnense]BBX82214.1 hypothetical protein MAUB_00870 [Mycolicibacterium aubagnense]
MSNSPKGKDRKSGELAGELRDVLFTLLAIAAVVVLVGALWRGGPAAVVDQVKAAASWVTRTFDELTGTGSVQTVPPATTGLEGASSNGSGLAYGPGPTAYSVQPQPAAGSCQYRYTASAEPLPDPVCTPGAANPKVTQSNLDSTVCKSGYTKSIRPPVSVTRVEKQRNAESYSFTGDLAYAEYDHLVSLVLGGDPNDSRNLWVEPPSPSHRDTDGVNNPKDLVEVKLAAAVCSRRVQLADAQSAIATDWTTALQRLGL